MNENMNNKTNHDPNEPETEGDAQLIEQKRRLMARKKLLGQHMPMSGSEIIKQLDDLKKQ
jgi:hypothetical protein